jgi:hypothetical protein
VRPGALPLLWLVSLAPPAWGGELYRWVDAQGVVHFTDQKSEPGLKPYRSDESLGPVRGFVPDKPDQDEGFGGEKRPLMLLPHSRGPAGPPLAPSEFDALLREAAEHYKLPFAFLKAIAKVESNFNPRAVSRAQAKGLMQLIDTTAADQGVRNIFDPKQNVYAAARYLRILANLFDGDLALTAAAYNAGPDRVSKAGGVPPIPETTDYVRRVLQLYRQNLEGGS